MNTTAKKKEIRIYRFAYCIVLGILLIGVLCVSSVFAEEKRMANSENGKFLYFAVDNNVYRMNTNTGKYKLITNVSQTKYIGEVIYYKDYLYFAGNDYGGSDSSAIYIYRMTKEGKKISKLDSGYKPRIYNGKIYYVKFDISYDDYGYPTENVVGISRMNINGKEKKVLFKPDDIGMITYMGFEIIKDRFYYIRSITKNNTSNITQLSSCSFTGNNIINHYSASSIDSDGDYIYYKSGLCYYKMNSSGKSSFLFKPMNVYVKENLTYIGVKGKNILYCNNDYPTYQMYCCPIKNKYATSVVLKNRINYAFLGSGKYFIIYHYVSGHENICARMTVTGDGYKEIQKYYRS